MTLGFGAQAKAGVISAQGVEVVETVKRRWVDIHWFRSNSYFSQRSLTEQYW